MKKSQGPARGYRTERGYRVAVTFPKELFDKINARATATKKSFSAMVVELCACGERDLDDSDQWEPKPEGAAVQ